MEITQLKLIKSTKLHVAFTKTDLNGKKQKLTFDSEADVHEDVRTAYKKLIIHFALLIEEVLISEVKSVTSWGHEVEKKLERLRVTSFSRGGTDDDPGVVLTGYKVLKGSGKAITINSPFIRFNESEETGYKYISELEGHLAELEVEGELYMDGTKFTPPQQTELPLDDKADKVTKMQIAGKDNSAFKSDIPASKEKPTRKKKKQLELDDSKEDSLSEESNENGE